MATVKVLWQASPELVAQELVATGQAAPAERTAIIDLPGLSEAERQALLALTEPILGAEVSLRPIDLRTRLELSGQEWRDDRVFKTAYTLSAAPDTPARVLAAVAARAALEEPAHTWRTAADARKAQEAAAKRAENARHMAAYQEMRPKLEALIAAGDHAALNQASAFAGPVDRPEWYDWGWRPGNGRSLYALQDEALKELREAERKAEQARQDADKAAWVEGRGSAHLKRCVASGYDCQRLYVTERAALEAPGFEVDFNNAAGWKVRSCPSAAALDAEDAARGLGLGEPEVVWLTKPPSDKTADVDGADYDDEYEFAAREAVVLRRYLGKYDLVKII